MRSINSVCVYCGSAPGRNPLYATVADELGRTLAGAGVRLVYGGGSVGLMGRIARSVLAHGGSVTGIIPQFLADREVMLKDADDLVVTADMHERKRLMFEKSDAFVAMPGGIGTLEEVVEMMTWAQLGQHDKPIALLDVDGFWRPLVDLLDHMRAEAFIRPGYELRYEVVAEVADLLPRLEAAQGAAAGRPEDAAVLRRM
ncbi:TIGR00730 family Rossman fold protein [Pseudoxanthobacter sp. M-2]|uniref:LOG family protein n=1 Tax=Pseudoxanthobacter sp. M-2 TaxID=3078754 RepID=UPI0038FD0805